MPAPALLSTTPTHFQIFYYGTQRNPYLFSRLHVRLSAACSHSLDWHCLLLSLLRAVSQGRRDALRPSRNWGSWTSPLLIQTFVRMFCALGAWRALLSFSDRFQFALLSSSLIYSDLNFPFPWMNPLLLTKSASLHPH